MPDRQSLTRSADPLVPADYRRMFDVLDGVTGRRSLECFCGRLLDALDDAFGWRRAFVVEGAMPGPSEAGIPLPAHCFDTFGGSFLEEYVTNWQAGDPLSVDRAIAAWQDQRVVGMWQFHYPVASRRRFFECLLRRNGLADILMCGSRVGGRVVTLGVGFDEGADAGSRERAIMYRLWPHLVLHFQSFAASTSSGTGEWSLTSRERLVTELVADGLTNCQIAQRLHITVDTVKKHLTHAMAKTECNSRTQLALRWRQHDRLGA
jgi:DNA-binding CsgD family transcriptional regulator